MIEILVEILKAYDLGIPVDAGDNRRSKKR